MALITQHPSTLSIPENVTGLTDAEVQERVKRGETNDFEARVGRSYLQILQYNVFNVFNIVLFILLLIVLLSQDYLTVLFAGFSVLTNSLSGSYQEIQAKRKLNQLASLADDDVEVLRSGKRIKIPRQQIVKDDVVFIRPGDRLPVDGVVIHDDGLEIDESQLTGESDAILKAVGDDVSSGSFCISGSGMMRVTEVGRDTTVNRLTTIAKVYKNTLTPTQKRLSAIVQVSMVVFAVMGPMVFIAQYLRGETFFDNVRGTIVFTTSLVPQGLILVTILSLTLGALKISQRQTLVQRINAVESLANVSVLCFDKTGTLTHNQLSVVDVIPLDGQPPDEIDKALMTYIANLAYRNSTTQAIAGYFSPDDYPEDLPVKAYDIPFTSARKWGALIFANDTLVLGAPERLFVNSPQIADQMRQFGGQGLRVVAFARAQATPDPDVSQISEDSLEPLALILISDQLRVDIQQTLADFTAQNVKLKVISGDNLETVRSIAKQAGMDTGVAYTGTDLDVLHDDDFDQAVATASVFARIEPDTKRRIIQSLKRQGEYVAMVGDGVNDVPALKEADLAVVMNNGAQISKDIADIVLLNNAMSTLPLAFKEGTEITQTLYGSTKMFLAKNLYNVIGFILIMFMTLPFPTTPIQISWAAFGTNNIPGGLIAFGFIRPKFIKNFRDDVMDFVITMSTVGGVGFALMFLVAYQYSDVDTARNASTIFFLMFGTIIVWNVMGVDILRPRTILQNFRAFLVPPVLIIPVLTLATFFPNIFDFAWPPLELVGLVAAIVALCTLVVSVGLKNNGLLQRFYSLFQK